MAYGTVKVDNITFTNGGIDQTVTVSGIVQSISGNITATGTIQAATIIGTSTVSGATVTGNAGVFTTVTGGSAGFTTVTGTTVTGTTANFATLSGTTITGSVGNFGSGSAAAPSVSVGTTDNGLYSPGTDQVAISTNGTGRLFVNDSGTVTVASAALNFGTGGVSGFISANNYWGAGSSDWNFNAGHLSQNFIWKTTTGAERMRLDSSGRLGLGTSTPAAKFETVDTASSLTYPLAVSNRTNPATDVGAGIDFRLTTGSNSRGYIACRYTSNSSSDGTYLSFAPNDGSTGNVERMRLTSAGRLGVGTTTMGRTLSVNGSIQVSNADSGWALGNGLEILHEVDGESFFINRRNAPMRFHTNNTERARIDASGRLLVGTSSSAMSGGVVQQNGNLGIIANTATNVATNGTLDITINSGGGCFTGFMIVENTLSSNAASRTQTLYAVMGRGTSATFTSLATADGSTSCASFSLSCPSNGVIRVTNTHGGATSINLCWYGPTGY